MLKKENGIYSKGSQTPPIAQSTGQATPVGNANTTLFKSWPRKERQTQDSTKEINSKADEAVAEIKDIRGHRPVHHEKIILPTAMTSHGIHMDSLTIRSIADQVSRP
eukprot:9136017-Ditylum_brightwellii.AAC.1